MRGLGLALGFFSVLPPNPGKQLWDLLTHWNPLFPYSSPYPLRTQMTSWWPRLSVQAMMRTWRSVSLVLVSAFPPSPAPGPCNAAGEGGDCLPPGPSPGCAAGFSSFLQSLCNSEDPRSLTCPLTRCLLVSHPWG